MCPDKMTLIDVAFQLVVLFILGYLTGMGYKKKDAALCGAAAILGFASVIWSSIKNGWWS